MEKDLTAHFSELYATWFDAITTEGIGPLEDLLADEWWYTNYDGVVRGKEEYLAWVADQGAGVTFVGPYDLTVTRPADLVDTRRLPGRERRTPRPRATFLRLVGTPR